MKKPSSRRLAAWQIVLITLGAVLIAGPMVWDAVVALFDNLANIQLREILTRDGMFVIGFVLLLVVGIYEFAKDARDKPTSKYIK